MTNKPLSTIWFHKESNTFYQVSQEFKFLEGEHTIKRFDGVTKNAAEEALKEFILSEEETEKIIQDWYDLSRKTMAKAFSALTQFALMKKRPTADDSDGKSEKSKTGPNHDWFSELKDRFKNEENVDEKDLEELGDSLSQLQNISNLFNGDSLKKGAGNPEEWVAQMEEALAKSSAEKKKKRKKKKKKNKKAKEQMELLIRKQIQDAKERNE